MRPDRRFGLGRAWRAIASAWLALAATVAVGPMAPGQEWRAEPVDPRGHTGDILAVATSGKVLATAGSDGLAKVWDLGFGKPLAHRLDLASHEGKVLSVAVSPDGRVVATGGDDRTVRLWGSATGKPLAKLRGHSGPVEALAFRPDGKVVASGSLDTTIRLWDVESGRSTRTLQGHEQGVRGLAFRPDGQALASCGRDSTVRLWDLAEGEKEPITLGLHNGPAWSVAFAPGSKLIASGGLDRTIRLWRADPAPGEPPPAPKAARNLTGANALTFAQLRQRSLAQGQVLPFDRPDGSFTPQTLGQLGDPALQLTTFVPQPGDFNRNQPNQIQLWQMEADVAAVGFTPDGQFVAAALSELRAGSTAPGSVAFFAPAAADRDPPQQVQQIRMPIRGHLGPILGLAFETNGQSVATVGADASVRLWDPFSADPLAASIGRSQPEAVAKRAMVHLDPVDALAIMPDGLRVATVSRSAGLSLWDARARALIGRLPGLVGPSPVPSTSPDGRVLVAGTSFTPVRALAITPDGKTLAIGGDARAVSLVEAATGRTLGTLRGHLGAITALAFSPDGKTLASGSKDASVTIWDVAKQAELATLARHTSTVTALAFRPDGSTLATAGLDHSVKLWEVPSGRFLDALDAHQDAVDALAFDPSGSTLASGDRSGTVRLWDPAKRSERLAIAASSEPVRAMAYSPDGKALVVVGDDRAIRRWDPVAGRAIAVRPEAHAAPILGLAFAVDGKTLATGGADRELKVWDLDAQVAPGRFAAIEGKVRQLAVSPDGKTLATASGDQLVRIWDAAEGRERTPAIPFESGDGEARLAFSPDSRSLAVLPVGTSSDPSKVWEVATGKLLEKAARNPTESRAIVFDPGGQSWLTNEESTVHVWGLGRGRQVLDFAGANGPIRSMAFSPDGKRLAAGLLDGSIVFLDGADDAPKAPETFRPSDVPAEVLVFSPDGRSIAVGGPDRVVRVLNASGGSVRHTLRGPRGAITGLSFSPDGKALASAADGDPALFVWDAASGELISNPMLAGASVTDGFACLAFAPDGKTLHAGGDRGVRSFDMTEGHRPPPQAPFGGPGTARERATLLGHASGVRSVAFAEGGERLVSRGDDGALKVWDLVDGNRARFTTGAVDFKAQSIALSPDGKTLAVGLRLPANRLQADESRTQARNTPRRRPGSARQQPAASAQKMADEVRFLDLGSGEPRGMLSAKATNGGVDRVIALAYSRDGKALATASQGGLVRLWDADLLEPPKWLIGPASPVSFLQFSPDGRTLLGAGSSGQVTLWDVKAGQVRGQFTHLGGINQVQISPDGQLVATVGGFVPQAQAQVQAQAQERATRTRTVMLVPDTGPGSGGDVRLWDLATARRVAVLPMTSGRATRLAFSKDGKVLAAATTSPMATVWDVATASPVCSLAWPSGEARSLAFSPDGLTLAVGGEDRTLRVWDVPAGTLRADLIGHTDAITSLAFSPDGKTIATAGRDAVVKLWDLPPPTTRP